MHIQRIRPTEVPICCSYFILMGSNYFQRNEELDSREQNLLNYLQMASEFYVNFWHSKKDLRRSVRAIALNGLDLIYGAQNRSDFITMREYLKDNLIAYLKLTFGEDFIELMENKVETIVKLIGDKSYEEFTSENKNLLLIETIENMILDEATKKNLIRH